MAAPAGSACCVSFMQRRSVSAQSRGRRTSQVTPTLRVQLDHTNYAASQRRANQTLLAAAPLTLQATPVAGPFPLRQLPMWEP